jgi:hypothetical protein
MDPILPHRDVSRTAVLRGPKVRLPALPGGKVVPMDGENNMKKKTSITVMILLLLASFTAEAQERTATLSRMQNKPKTDGVIGEDEYTTMIELSGMRIGLSLGADTLYVGMSAETEGWLGIGFNPKKTMDGAVIFIGFLTGKNAQLKVQKGVEWTHVDLNADLLNLFAMNEENGETSMELAVKASPLIAQGQKELGIIAAYGPSKDFTSDHEGNRYSVTVKIE